MPYHTRLVRRLAKDRSFAALVILAACGRSVGTSLAPTGTGTQGTTAAVATVTVSPATSSALVAANTQFTAVLKDAGGTVLTGRSISWTTSNAAVATVSASGLTSALAAGVATITAMSQGVSGTAVLTVTAPPLSATLTQVILTPATASVAVGATQQFTAGGVWSNGATTAPAVTYSATGGTITASGLYTAGNSTGTFRVIAVQQGGTLADTAVVTVTAPASATILLSEGFENGDLGSRGWFDVTSVAVTTDARPGSSGTHALQWHWAVGTVAPQGSSRFDFTPSNSVYLSYWVKMSSNWIGSGQLYHPHMFSFLTTADDHYIGPSITHLTLYDELLYRNGNLMANLSVQDALMIDPSKLNVDLRGITENRSIGGYNGQHEVDDATSTVTWDTYLYSAGQYTNYRNIHPKAVTIPDSSKNSWHHIESYWQMNTIVGGVGQQDGVIQYWVDGTLLVDRHNVYFRTGANPTMQFRTFFMGPYIGDGSPVDQYMWIDDLTVATAHP